MGACACTPGLQALVSLDLGVFMGATPSLFLPCFRYSLLFLFIFFCLLFCYFAFLLTVAVQLGLLQLITILALESISRLFKRHFREGFFFVVVVMKSIINIKSLQERYKNVLYFLTRFEVYEFYECLSVKYLEF